MTAGGTGRFNREGSGNSLMTSANFEEMSLLAGESVGQTKRLMSAASIIDEMISGAEAVIRKRLEAMVVD
jgi:nitronate monooxygenase